MTNHDLIFIILAFLSEILGTISGFGSSTFFVPFGALFEKFQFVLVLTSALHIFGNSSRLFHYRQTIDKNLIFKYVVPSIVMSALGALLNPYFPVPTIKIILGTFLIIFSIYFLFIKPRAPKIENNKNSTNQVLLVATSGFLTGLIGTGGSIRGAALVQLQLGHPLFVMLSSLIDLGGDIIRFIIYIYNGYADWSQWFYFPLLALSGYFGTLLGKRIAQKIPENLLNRIILYFILMGGLVLLF